MSESFNQKLANKVWENPRFQEAMKATELAWLKFSLKIDTSVKGELNPKQLMESAAILACSADETHRHAAFNIATKIYELFGAESLPLEQALRVVLARLKNFPSFETRKNVKNAESLLPLSLAVEEEKAKQDNKVTVGGKEILLTEFQRKLWQELSTGKNIALTAPTSAGKSFLLQNYLSHIFENDEPKTVIYVVPTRALISQVSRDIEKNFADFSGEKPKIITIALTAEENTPERVIYVLTQERAQLALSANNDFKADIIIVDEAHNMADGSRGVLLYGVITDLLTRNRQAQILFAGPGIKNLDIFRSTFNLREFSPLPSTEATVGQNFLITNKLRGRKFSISTNKFENIKNITFPINPSGLREKIIQATLYLGKEQTNIIYANGAAVAEEYAASLAEQISIPLATEQQERLNELASFVQEVIHVDYKLAPALKKGVGFHYGGMPSYVRDIVEEAFSAGDISYLCSTSTLLQGVNLPAKNIFMVKPKRGNGNPLESVDFWNLAGRAGRLMKEFQGNIYLVDYENWDKQPLDQERTAEIQFAISETIQKYESQLQAEINGQDSKKDVLQETCETVFTRLLTDYKESILEQTWQQLNIDETAQVRLTEALQQVSDTISLPDTVLKQNPTVSPRRQQALFNYIEEQIENHQSDTLIPAFPKKDSAYDSYCRILQICRSYIMNINDNTHTYIAQLAVKWAKGMPVPQMISESIDYHAAKNPDKSRDTIIRETLKDIETYARFQAVRLFNCYNSLLIYAFEQRKLTKLLGQISPVATYLELGACDTTALNLMSLGLSRHTALKLQKLLTINLDLNDTISRLRNFRTDNSELLEFSIREIERVQKAL